jgi:hypothetical protein
MQWASDVHEVQLAETPLHRYAPQDGLPEEPAVRRVQRPPAPQTSHLPEQAELQHTPSTQLPVPHTRHAAPPTQSVAVLQAAP